MRGIPAREFRDRVDRRNGQPRLGAPDRRTKIGGQRVVGRRDAFETATLPHLDAVTLALSMTRDRADSDDLVQETYLRALRGWSTFRPGADARG